MAVTIKSPSEPYNFKILLIGDSLVGKSCLITRYADDHFEPNFIATIGVDFKMKRLDLGENSFQLQIWDTAGQERFCNITRSYYRGCDAIIIVYDLTNRESFLHVEKWLVELEQNADDGTVKLLIANKSDLVEKRVITHDEGHRLATANNMSFIETSALTGDNVAEVFKMATLECKAAYDARGGPRSLNANVAMDKKNGRKRAGWLRC
eukprot:TRINITY_DN20865_c0_g1_i1.p1 TRINITY_DN20865_c0_g1~~TRINITY_DN20865_c0_g1_i1.p1  ORF type:complete len:236 (+),score=46.47 TRINITY_DN20865_c0_g1_i1:87-710(+)